MLQQHTAVTCCYTLASGGFCGYKPAKVAAAQVALLLVVLLLL
jgi:hypothetical protein